MNATRYICPVCHETAEWRACFECLGTGSIDLGSLDMHHCPICEAKGGYWQCPNHHNAEPVKEPSK